MRGEGTSPRRRTVRGGLVVGIAGAAACAGTTLSVHAEPTPPVTSPRESAIGAEAVDGLAVSPLYLQTGLVVAATHTMSSCQQDCVHLWTTHDGGASWHRVAARNWQQGRPTVLVGGDGREVLLASGSRSLQRSGDGGESWTDAGPGGVASPLPSFSRDGAVAVASASNGGNADYLVRNGQARAVSGSGNSAHDLQFSVSPTFPDGGAFAPALLSATDVHSGTQEVLRCTSDLLCSSPVTLTGNEAMSGGAVLVPSPAYATDGTVFAYTGTMFYRSSDGGRSFGIVKVGDAVTVVTAPLMVALAPHFDARGSVRTLYVAITEIEGTGSGAHTAGGVYRSDDAGGSFTRVHSGSPLDDGASAVAVAPDGRLFAGYLGLHGGGLMCDAGTGWQATCPAMSTSAHGGPSMRAGGCSTSCASTGGAAGSGDSAAGAGAAGAGGSGADSAPAAEVTRNASAAQPGGRRNWGLVAGAGGVAAVLALGGALLRRTRTTQV